jgi:hypothetical protein
LEVGSKRTPVDRLGLFLIILSFQDPRATARLPALADVSAAQRRIQGHVHRTPLLSSRFFGDRIGARVYLKAENLQRGGSNFELKYSTLGLSWSLARHPGELLAIDGRRARRAAWKFRLAFLFLEGLRLALRLRVLLRSMVKPVIRGPPRPAHRAPVRSDHPLLWRPLHHVPEEGRLDREAPGPPAASPLGTAIPLPIRPSFPADSHHHYPHPPSHSG